MEVTNKEITDRIEVEMAKASWKIDMNRPGSRHGTDFDAIIMGFEIQKDFHYYAEESFFSARRLGEGEEEDVYFMKRTSVAYDINRDAHAFENFIVAECEFVEHVRKVIAAEKEAEEIGAHLSAGAGRKSINGRL